MRQLFIFLLCLISVNCVFSKGADSAPTTVTVEEIMFWMSDSPKVKDKILEVKDRINSLYPRWPDTDNDAHVIAAAEALSLKTRILDGDVLIQCIPKADEKKCHVGDSEDPCAAYILGLAYVSERCNNYIVPSHPDCDSSLYCFALTLYKDKDKGWPQINRQMRLDSLFDSDEVDPHFLVSYFHFLPEVKSNSNMIIYDKLKTHLDGALAESMYDYIIDNYMANEAVRNMIVEKK